MAIQSFSFESVIQYMKDSGVYQYVLPFLLIFAIIFAILEKTKIFGEDKTNINVIISLVIGLLLVAQQGLVETINSFLPKASFILVVILVILITFALLAGKEYKGLKGGVLGIAALITLIAIIVALDSSGPSWLGQQDKDTILTIGIPLIIVIILIYLLTYKKKKPSEKGWLKTLAKGIGGDDE